MTALLSPVAQVFADEWPRLVATLMRDLGDLSLAEDVAQDAFVEAAARWGPTTTPDRPGAWLLTTARRRAIDTIRRSGRLTDRLPLLAQQVDATPNRGPEASDDTSANLGDAQLAIVFGCCHPALSTEAQMALTLRHVAGLSTAQIARSFVVGEETMAKRLVRAKRKVRESGIPFAVPAVDRLADRLEEVLGVIYLIFTEGHTASDAGRLLRGDLCDEARWLANLVADLLPDEPEAIGLAAMLAFTDARRSARTDDDGELVLLENQDRTLWDAALIAEGHAKLERALLMGHVGPFQLQAAIAAVHASAPTAHETNWPMIADLYRRLYAIRPSPVIALNMAAAVGIADQPEAGLELIDRLIDDGELLTYPYLPSARADLLRRSGRLAEAATAYREAIALHSEGPERRYLERRLTEVTSAPEHRR